MASRRRDFPLAGGLDSESEGQAWSALCLGPREGHGLTLQTAPSHLGRGVGAGQLSPHHLHPCLRGTAELAQTCLGRPFPLVLSP